jgi:histidine ammonia-lyase
MTSGIDPRRASIKLADGRHSLGICRALKLLRAARLMLSSVGAVEGLSRSFDGDVRMVRTAVGQLEEWAKQEGIKL